MTKANWEALIAAMREKAKGPYPFMLSGLELLAVLHELEVLGGADFLTVTEPPPKALERAR